MKKLLFTMFLMGALLLVSLPQVLAQVTISGNIKDASTEQALIGATVLIKGTQTGTVTDIDGNYTISTSEESGIVVFSFIGYKSQEMAFNGDQVIDLSLADDSETLEEVVVVAYGTQKKSHLTGAVASLKNDGLDEIAASRADQALQGKLAGVQILNLNPEAGAAPTIRVRGMGSISAGSEPLVVIDGYPMPEGSDGLSMVSMGDVESIEVLKDAASSALYGSRAAGGVILITTKVGSEKKTKYNFKMYTGISKPVKLPDMMSIEEYVELLYSEAELRMQDPAVDGTSNTSEWNIVTGPEQTGYLISKYAVDEPTDWADEALRNHGSINSYALSASGGNEKTQFYVAGNYNSEEGIMEKSSYSKFSFRAKVDLKLSERIKIGFNLTPTYSTKERPQGNLTNYIRYHSWVPVYYNEYTAAMTGGEVGEYAQVTPFGGTTITGVGADGEVWNMNGQNPWTTSSQNPVSVRERTSRIDENYRLASNAYFSVDIIDGLLFKTSLSAYYSYNEYNMKEQTSAQSAGDVNRLTREMTTYSDLLSESILSYDKTIGSHDFNVMAGFTAQKSRKNENNIEGTGFPDEERMSFNLSSDIVKEGTTSYYVPEQLMSWLGRVTYAFQGKYLASAAMRADGSTKFAPGNQWGTFPSASLGWRISEEAFMANLNAISNLKIRGSWGITGNNNIPEYSYQNLVSKQYKDGDEEFKDYSLGSGNGTLNSTISSTDPSLGNPDISWEQLEEINFGLDMGFVKNRYNASIEYYISNSKELLLAQPAMYITGHKSSWNNIGTVNNTGIEVEIKANVISRKDFNWIITGNISHNKNTLKEYGELDLEDRFGERAEVYRAEVGQPAIQYYGYKTDGVWTSYEEAASAIADTGFVYKRFAPIAGGIKVADVDGNDTIDSGDRINLGSPYPDFTWAITNSFTYKNFDASFLFQGSQGGELVNGNINYNEQLRMNKAYTENRWISPMYPGDGQTVYSTTTPGSDLMLTDYAVEDASYIALREISIGYTLPSGISKMLYLSNLRAYISATNLIYIMGSNYRGINPEARTTSGNYDDPLIDGYQRGAFPLNKSFTFGLDITF